MRGGSTRKRQRSEPQTAAATALTDAVSDVLKCAVCVGPLRQCVALVPCGHLFCKQCIDRWSRAREGNNTCPTCRARATADPVPLRAVDELQLLLHDGVHPSPCSVCAGSIAEPSLCELCDTAVPMCPSCAEAWMGRCDDCERWFCDACAGRQCRWCRLRSHPSSHVCSDCTQSTLSQCPSPLNGGL
eukprot:1426442-Prymnesium_polylepis.1